MIADVKTVDHNAEQAVLGAVLISSSALAPLIVDEALAADHFGHEPHRRVFAAILKLHDAGREIDSLTVARASGLEENRIDALAASVPDAANVREYARLVKRASLRRRWHQASLLLGEAAANDDEELAGEAERELSAPIAADDTYDQPRLAAEIANYFDESQPVGITTGFADLDDILAGGLRRGNTTVLAAWEAMGKSVLVLQWLALTANNGLKAHLYTNDTPVGEMALRTIAHLGAAPWHSLARRRLSDEQADKVLKISSSLPFGMTDTSDFSTWGADEIARHIRVNRWDLCAVDVLHNMPYRDENDLRTIAATLKGAAQSVGTHLVLVCHFNQERAKEKTLPWPVRRDLRGSGMLAKLAANIIFLHRPQHESGDAIVTDEYGHLWADKARSGLQGRGIDLVFEPQRMRFRLENTLERQTREAAA